MDHFTYFMLRLRHPVETAAGPAVTGIIQHLATGEKRVFGDAGELVELLLAWSEARHSKVDPVGGKSNALVR